MAIGFDDFIADGVRGTSVWQVGRLPPPVSRASLSLSLSLSLSSLQMSGHVLTGSFFSHDSGFVTQKPSVSIFCAAGAQGQRAKEVFLNTAKNIKFETFLIKANGTNGDSMKCPAVP